MFSSVSQLVDFEFILDRFGLCKFTIHFILRYYLTIGFMKELNSLFKGLSLIALSISFYACEKCSDCVRDRFDGTCTCLGVSSSQEDLSYTEEISWKQACETSSECEWSSTASGEDTEEVCDSRAEMEAEVLSKEAVGWECTDQ
jgi:hypothetical protein